eukprot:CAMPEP_0172449592 /NCGR_PEP_ID=MMETSP1065-20121228/8263_2 /TAXON_ID=265537 /ORGANISM="Amphiprora paludosa, Strain CCMP125" /LENGTH=59 /DNA_ID= /DNA_START= /DNA_END= /DNA_ORIENTATION=
MPVLQVEAFSAFAVSHSSCHQSAFVTPLRCAATKRKRKKLTSRHCERVAWLYGSNTSRS